MLTPTLLRSRDTHRLVAGNDETAHLALCEQGSRLFVHLLSGTHYDRLRYAERQKLRRILTRVHRELTHAQRRLGVEL